MERAAPHGRVDPDFAREVLADLYVYRRKRPWVAWLAWVLLGWTGGHRFYLERYGTALLMMLTGGGFLLWWLADGVRVMPLVRQHNDEQARRERSGEPPLELEFMPTLRPETLDAPAAWVDRWRSRDPARRRLRSAADVLVLVVAGVALGSLGAASGAGEAVAAVLVVMGATVMGTGPAWAHDLPLVRALLRWSQRLRLFYYFNEPGPPAALLLRSVTGPLLAPFRKRARAEVRLYLSLGVGFTLAFLLVDAAELARELWAGAAYDPAELLSLLVEDAATTFVVVYAFAAPIGAVLTLHLLTRRTHAVPRALSLLTLLAMAVGFLSATGP